MNKIMIVGNLTADPELRSTASNIPVCQFTVAVQRRFANQSGEKVADFIPVVVWRQLAELCSKFLAKGRKVAVSGSLQMRRYEDKQGNKRTAYEIQADEVEFLTPRSESGGGTGSGDMPTYKTESFGELSGFTEMDDSDLPF